MWIFWIFRSSWRRLRCWRGGGSLRCGLSVGGCRADVSEDANLNDGLVSGDATLWVHCRFPSVCGELWKTSQTVSHSFSIPTAICFWSVWKGEKVNVVEVLIDKCVEMWENLRLGLYSNEGSLSVSEVGVEARWRRGHSRMFVGWGIFDPQNA